MDVEWSAFVDHLIAQRLSEKTIRRYLRWVRDAARWFDNQGSGLEEATATDVRAWSETHVTPSHSSRGQAAAALRHYWEHVEHPKPPNKAIRVPPSPEYECRAVTEIQAHGS